MPSSYLVRTFREGDEAGIDELLRVCFPQYKGMQYWDWIHRQNPLGFHGEEGDVWVAQMDRKIVGYYGRIRYRFWFFGDYVYGVQGAQIATHPEVRRQGVALKILSYAWLNSKSQDIRFGFGYPNQTARLAVKKFVSSELIPTSIVVKVDEPVRILDRTKYLQSQYKNRTSRIRATMALLPNRRSGRQIEGIKVHGVEIAGRLMDDAGSVWSSVRHLIDIGIERSVEYLKWRYNPRWGNYIIISAIRENETVGYAVLKPIEKREVPALLICELLARNDDRQIYALLLKEVLDRAHEIDASYIKVSTSCLPGGIDSLLNGGFSLPAAMLQRATISRAYVQVTLHGKETAETIAGAKWYHSIGDRDFS